MLHALRLSRLAAPLPALLLSACLFGKDRGTFTYTTEIYGDTRIVHAYNADGSRKKELGPGVEITASQTSFFAEGGILTLWPDLYGFEAPADSSWVRDDDLIVDSALTDPDWSSTLFARATRDSLFLTRLVPGLLFPLVETVRGYAGFPCTFSRPRAFQIGGGMTDTIFLKVSGMHFDRADTVRLAVLIDAAASLAADARVDWNDPVTAEVDVTCPEP